MIYEKYLPIGTVVELKESKGMFAIMGFCIVDQKNDNRQYDYVGVMYPAGYLNSRTVFRFDHEDIDKVYSVGYSDENEKKFKERLKESVKYVSTDKECHHISFEKLKDLLSKGMNNEQPK